MLAYLANAPIRGESSFSGNLETLTYKRTNVIATLAMENANRAIVVRVTCRFMNILSSTLVPRRFSRARMNV